MEIFKTVLTKTKDKDGLTIIEFPFNVAEVFNVKKSTIRVYGSINGVDYKNKLISRVNGNYIMVVDKKLQKKIGFCGDDMEIEVTIVFDERDLYGLGDSTFIENGLCNIDVLIAVNSFFKH